MSNQAIGITEDGCRSSQLRLCREVAADFHVAPGATDLLIDTVVTTIREDWDEVSDFARLTAT